MKKKVRIILIFVLCLLLLTTGVGAWLLSYYHGDETAVSSLTGNDKVQVEKGDYISFNPKGKSVDTALIFYPGGKVEAEAYAPLCSKIAEGGYRVIIVPMPVRLAVFGADKARTVIEANPDIKNWAIGGHSLGGVMAAAYAYENKSVIKGLVLYASYPQNKHDLSGSSIKASSIWGSKDGVADLDKIAAARNLLPQDSIFFEIQGGNHGQFGSYGFQKGDKEADITAMEQQEQTAEQTVKLLQSISK